MPEVDDHKDGLFASIPLALAACVVCACTCSVILQVSGQLRGLNEILESIEEKDQTTQTYLRELKDTLVRLEAVQEAQKGVQVRTFDVRDFPPVEEDQPTVCTPDELDDDPTDPYKPGGPAGETGARSAGVSAPAPLHI